MSSLWQNLRIFKGFLISISISGDSVSYLSEMIMLISFAGTQTRTIMRDDRVTLPCKWFKRGLICLLYGKIPTFLYVLYFQLLFLEVPRPISFKWLCLLVWNIPCSRMGFGRVTLSSKGYLRGQYVFVMAKSQSFYRVSIFNYYCWRHSVIFHSND